MRYVHHNLEIIYDAIKLHRATHNSVAPLLAYFWDCDGLRYHATALNFDPFVHAAAHSVLTSFLWKASFASFYLVHLRRCQPLLERIPFAHFLDHPPARTYVAALVLFSVGAQVRPGVPAVEDHPLLADLVARAAVNMALSSAKISFEIY